MRRGLAQDDDELGALRVVGNDDRPVAGLALTVVDDTSAYLGTMISGYPNLFVMTGPNTGLGHNSMVFMVESQLNYVLDCLRTLRENDCLLKEMRCAFLEADGSISIIKK